MTDAQPREHSGNAFGKSQQLTVSDALYYAQERVGAPEQHGTLLQVTVPAGEYWSERLFVAPANADLAARGDESFPGSERRLALGLDGAAVDFDLVVIDCGPTLGTLFLAALYAADGAVLVSEPADNSVEGLPRTVNLLADVRAQRGGTAPLCSASLPRMHPPVRLALASCSSLCVPTTASCSGRRCLVEPLSGRPRGHTPPCVPCQMEPRSPRPTTASQPASSALLAPS